MKPAFKDHDLRVALAKLMHTHGDDAVINAALAIRDLHQQEQRRISKQEQPK